MGPYGGKQGHNTTVGSNIGSIAHACFLTGRIRGEKWPESGTNSVRDLSYGQIRTLSSFQRRIIENSPRAPSDWLRNATSPPAGAPIPRSIPRFGHSNPGGISIRGIKHEQPGCSGRGGRNCCPRDQLRRHGRLGVTLERGG